MVEHEFWVLFVNAPIVKEVSDLDKVHAHFNHLLEEYLFALFEKVLAFLVAAHRPLCRELLLDESLSRLTRWHGDNFAFSEKVEQLAWHFL